jgi:ABC-type branched-subunit amino acid transport system substrate-binding protein
MAEADFAKLLTEANQLGITGTTFVGGPGVLSAHMFELAGDLVEGQYGIGTTALASDNPPGIEKLNSAIKQYVPSATVSGVGIFTWASAQLLEKAIKDAGDCLNADTLNKALESFSNVDLGGLMGPVSFSPTDHLGNESIALYHAVKGTWQNVSGFVH